METEKTEQLAIIEEEWKVLESAECLHCGTPLTGFLLVTGLHADNCAWNYYFECPKCHYQNNVAKLIGHGCSCPEGWEPSETAQKDADDLNASDHCRKCGRALKVPLSVKRGIGPICWHKLMHGISTRKAPMTKEEKRAKARERAKKKKAEKAEARRIAREAFFADMDRKAKAEVIQNRLDDQKQAILKQTSLF